MLFSEILGQSHLKKHLTNTVDSGRIPHAQMFVGPEGSGTLPMAIAYARYILCRNKNGENTGGDSACNLKFEHLSHPDIHFIYPTVTTSKIKSKPKSLDFIKEWRDFLNDNPYGSLFDWYQILGVDNKQGIIRVDDATEIVKTLSLKSYEGGYKVMIVWMADKLNADASNKLLKILEEPTDKTVFILIVENEGDILQTIHSRCQKLYFSGIPEQIIADSLINKNLANEIKAKKTAHQAQGNYNKALKLLDENHEDLPFENWFVVWVRAAFRAKGRAETIFDLLNWSETIAKEGRETQKKFLSYCIEMFRQSLLLNYQTNQLVYMEPQTENFKLE
ncbi:MAG TPA: hypothetical protein VLZ72_09935, partial [Flavobacterium sp.]|nr:hypothetical protein [Flavobacterium sp.]